MKKAIQGAMLVLVVALSMRGSVRYHYDGTFDVPVGFYKDPNFVPASYLEGFPIKTTKEHLSEKRLDALCKLFIAACDASKKKLHQDYLISTSAPIYVLLKSNVPRVAEYESEGGQIVFLHRIKEALGTKHLQPPPPPPHK